MNQSEAMQPSTNILENLFLCTYNGDQVGLFRREKVEVSEYDLHTCGEYAEVFQKLGSPSHVGIRIKPLKDGFKYYLEEWDRFFSTSDREYTATCTMNASVSLTHLHCNMYNSGLTSNEIRTDAEFEKLVAYGYSVLGIKKSEEKAKTATKQ